MSTNRSVLRYSEQGSGHTTVLLIHGFPLCREMWRPQATALADAGYRVICPDLPGFGESLPVEGPVTMPLYADALIALLDKLGVENAVVGGMSMGGYVLLNLIERYPARLLGAMFLVTRASADDAAGKDKRSLLAAAVSAGNRLVVPDTFAGVLFAPDTPQEKPQLVAEVRQWMEAAHVTGLAGGLLAMRDRDDYIARLSGFTLPSLVVGAEQDLAVPLEHSRVLAERLPNAELQIISRAGHMANLEQPQAFNAALAGFLKRIKV